MNEHTILWLHLLSEHGRYMDPETSSEDLNEEHLSSHYKDIAGHNVLNTFYSISTVAQFLIEIDDNDYI